ncbi:MAG: gamma-glutamyl-gamma-aminobutyrate hydrolase family protein [Candidatus Moduliflexus flocculans]|nr:gamma-glutamyl-gamma-aminobutyrate hydrolase family protein [Candidatus Moduliflexus flocculans]
MLYCPENGTEADPIRRAALALADGTVLEGVGFGASAEIGGKSFSIPGSSATRRASPTRPTAARSSARPTRSSATTASIPSRFESERPQIAGYVVSELCARPSHATSRKTLDDWLRESGVPGIAGVDTRALTKKLRVHGVMTGLLAAPARPARPGPPAARGPGRRRSQCPRPRGRGHDARDPHLQPAGRRGPSSWSTAAPRWASSGPSSAAASRSSASRPTPTPAASWPSRRGASSSPTARATRAGPAPPSPRSAGSCAEQVPLFGICLGNQVLALAAGGATYKLPVRPPRPEPALPRGGHQALLHHQPEPRLRRRRGAPAPRLGRLVPQRQRRHERGHPPPAPARFRRPVPPRGLARARRTRTSSSTSSSRRPG